MNLGIFILRQLVKITIFARGSRKNIPSRVSTLPCSNKSTIPTLLLSLLVVGCVPQQQANFLRNGIGAQLPARDIDTASTKQRKYFNYLCQQAGLIKTASYAEPARDCVLEPYNAQVWTLIVHQGMNDIDRRCDGYLEWLDNKKRSKGPIISQLGTVQNTTTQILGATIGLSNAAKAITIVSQAFDLITKSIENYHTRLLLEIDQSTINSIVLRARHNFRKDFKGKQASNKPEAEYILRSYLRICLPFAIESTINDNSTLVSLGVDPDQAESLSIHQPPVSGVLTSSNQPVPPTPTPTKSLLKNPKGSWEPSITRSTAKSIQSALCVTKDGDFGNSTSSNTRRAIAMFQQATGNNPTGIIESRVQRTKLISANNCNFQKSKNAYEKFRFYTNNYTVDSQILAALRLDLTDAFNRTIQQSGVEASPQLQNIISSNTMENNQIGDNIRSIVKFISSNNNDVINANAATNGTITKEFEDALAID